MKHIKHIIIAALAALIINPAQAWDETDAKAIGAVAGIAGGATYAAIDQWGREATIGERGYIGAGGMYTAVDITCSHPGHPDLKCDDGYIGGRFYGGYMATENLGAEVGYILGGDYEVSAANYTNNGQTRDGNWTDTAKYSALYAAAVARLPVDDHLSLHGKLGVLSAREKITRTHNCTPGNFCLGANNGKKILIGGGIEYSFGDMSLRGEVMRLAKNQTAFGLELTYRL